MRTRRVPPPTSTAGRPPTNRRRRRRALIIVLIVLGIIVLVGLGIGIWRALGDDTPQVSVADVVNQTVATAKTQLEDDGFKVTEERVTNADVPVDIVISQDPKASAKADKGSDVTLTCAAPVPDHDARGERRRQVVRRRTTHPHGARVRGAAPGRSQRRPSTRTA